jgi:predicted lipid-binding transport protein (Tim44 family)
MADQLQREIEEILDKLDEFIPEQKATSRIRKQWSAKLHAFGGWLGGLVSHVSTGHLMIVSLVLVFIAFAFRSSAIGQYSMIAGLSLLGLTIVASFFANRRARSEKRWRGQVVDLSGSRFIDRLQSWFKKHGSRTH